MGATLRAAWHIAVKDVAIEWRTKTAFASGLVFAVLVLAVLFFSRDPTAVSAQDIAPGALWVTFTFAAMLALNRAFLIERELRALDGLLLTPAPRAAIFWGKFAANLVFVGAIEAISLPLFVLFYDVPIWLRLGELVLVIAMATIAFVAVGTPAERHGGPHPVRRVDAPAPAPAISRPTARGWRAAHGAPARGPTLE